MPIIDQDGCRLVNFGENDVEARLHGGLGGVGITLAPPYRLKDDDDHIDGPIRPEGGVALRFNTRESIEGMIMALRNALARYDGQGDLPSAIIDGAESWTCVLYGSPDYGEDR